MNTSTLRTVFLLAFPVFLPVAAHAAKATAEILPPSRRQASVKLAEELLNRTPPPPISADLPSPFNPVDFDKPDASEIKAPPAGTPVAPGGPAAPSKPAPMSDRSILEAVAARIPVTGSMVLNGKSILTGTGGKKFFVGSTFTVSDGNQDYDLEVVAIDRTTFTLRYRGEEITRNIRQK